MATGIRRYRMELEMEPSQAADVEQMIANIIENGVSDEAVRFFVPALVLIQRLYGSKPAGPHTHESAAAEIAGKVLEAAHQAALTAHLKAHR